MRKWLPLAAVCLGTFMLLIDVTIVNVALPSMARNLHTSFASLQWVVDGYALALAALMLGIGSVADLLGHRRAYLAGLVVFALASLICGFAPNSGVLIAARVVQGIGAAGIFAANNALLNSSYQGRDRGTAYGMWGAVVGASAAVGPIIGGVLTQALSWRWIFFVNLPVSVLAIVLTLRAFSGDRPDRDQRVDLPGMALFTVATGTLTYALIRANDEGWTTLSTYSLVLLSVAAFIAFFVVESRSSYSMLDLGLLRRPAFVGILIASLLVNFAAFASFTYTAIWLQSVIGLGPIQAGLTGLPLSVAAFAVSAVIGRHLHARAPGPIIGTGMILIGLGALINAAMIDRNSSWPALILGFAITGLGVGLATPTLNSSGMAAVPVHRGGMAGGAVNTVRQLGFAIGIAVLGTIFATKSAQVIADSGTANSNGVAHGLASGQAQGLLARAGAGRGHLNDTLHAAAASGLDLVFLVAGTGGLVGGVLVFLLVRPVREAAPVARPVAEAV
ncbi:MAG: MFS transporter [Jatrophihabitantaceae bacterium]